MTEAQPQPNPPPLTFSCVIRTSVQEGIISQAVIRRTQSAAVLDGHLASMQDVPLEEAQFIAGIFSQLQKASKLHPGRFLDQDLDLQWNPPLPESDPPPFNPGGEPPVRH